MAKTMKTMDGNEAAAYISYPFTEVAAIYPITPSSPMAELADLWSANGKKNLFGQTVRVAELQSEAGASGAVHGALQGGALTTTYTASQGLLLMIPNMYKIAGELLPGVFHVSARSLAAQALSIFGDHQDVMAARQTGFAMLASSSVQQVIDLGSIAHLASLKSRVPFLHFFDGFRTSHEIQKVELIEYEDLEKLVDYNAIREFRNRSLNPERPVLRGTAQNPDIYFQNREAANKFYEKVPEIVVEYMNEISKITGRDYKPFNYYGAKDADSVIVAMGSACSVIQEVIDYLVSKGEKVGLIEVHLYRPFCEKYFFDVLPKTVKKIAVLDRTKEPGSLGEPLYEDIRNMYYDKEDRPIIVGGRYGLGSKDTRPSQFIAVYNNLKQKNPKNNFTIGIVDDVTDTSLPEEDIIDTTPEGTIRCKFWGLGSDGTVGANKMAIKIIGDKTDLYAQGYFSYDSKKSGGTTVSHLRFGSKPINSSYLVYDADYIACHNKSYVYQYDLLKGLKENGTFVLNCPWSSEELDEKIPAPIKRYIAEKNIKFYTIDAVEVAQNIGLGGRINMIMQAAFFKLAEVIPIEDAVKYLKDSIKGTYGKKGREIVEMNYAAVDKGIENLVKIDVPEEWKNAEATSDEKTPPKDLPEFIQRIERPMARHEGDELPVSAFEGMEDGTFPLGTTKYEKRGIAVMVPQWQTDKCIQCNQCSYVCPHAVIRPLLLTDEEKKNAPNTFETKKAIGKGLEGYDYRIQISTLDCTGCGNCADICPAPDKALVMVNAEEEGPRQYENWEYAVNNITYKDELFKKETVKGSQFAQPLLEFHGACAGCGETAYLKYITQLYGDRMMIANATGCSSIWGGSAPSIPYCKNAEGKGPAWANSLFEDNAEYGYGMFLAVKQIRERLRNIMKEAQQRDIGADLKDAFQNWIDNMYDGEGSKKASKELLSFINNSKYKNDDVVQEILEKKDFLIKKSQWIVGGDGWAYDIGYGGLDHVLAAGEDVNVLVFDTEVYSNTGGQASKATPTAAAAKFAASGKKIRKKDLGMMAMSYGYVYVAQVSLGANMNHAAKVIAEAEAYPGPSLIIAYAPCVSHGIKTGMGTSVKQEKRAVESGFWHLYTYNPQLKEEGKNPFKLNSKEPKESFRDFILSELRFSQIKNTFPDIAEDLYSKAEEDAKDKYETYRRLSEMEY
ncbi:pyruvate:ferredoxin (flavodoxin) oxidoreductase [Sporosalibacterium faouarense]|uniref:pyruvate:ferredoxin (flavodoxin) oxidoreductase n=1 Tax=Sporosalibacterium faouarense TaxID=516123 RepID=UPI00192B738F|nr:pyruvate:ferredoxin (flavodoxin) oxidoreductase [Sporosalibacterium faouarense]